MPYEFLAAALLVTLILAVLKRRRVTSAIALLALVSVVAASSQLRHDFGSAFQAGYHATYAALGGVSGAR